MKIRGVEKELTWDATATRADGELTASAKTSFTFGDFGMQIPSVFSVISIVDDIRVEIEMMAKAAQPAS